MLPAARDAQLDFVRLVAEEPSSLYFEDFLRDGYDAWPATYRERFPGLATWCGVAGLKRTLQKIAGAGGAWSVSLASRSLPLLQHGARRMFRKCHRVLTTDLSWPTYQAAVVAEARRRRREVVPCPLRDSILHGGWTSADVVAFVAAEYARHGCDGLFLPAVDHLGVRMPVARIAEAIKTKARLRFTLVDAAQAFCHVPIDDDLEHADFVVAGSHKWMGAYLPLGMAFARQGDDAWRKYASDQNGPAFPDPLWDFTEQVAAHRRGGATETANVAGLMACSAAVRCHADRSWRNSVAWHGEANRIEHEAPAGAWRPLDYAADLQSRIRLFRNHARGAGRLAADDVRRQWLAAGYVVTGYDGGIARLSPPIATGWRPTSAATAASRRPTPRFVDRDAQT